MTMNCLGGKCRNTDWMRTSLVLAGAYHILFAVWVNLWPFHAFDVLGIPHPNHPMLWRVLGIISGAVGFALLIAAGDPIRHWLIVLLGFAKCIAATLIVSLAAYSGDLPAASLAFLPLDDLLWLVPFGAILWATLRAHTGIPLSRSQPYSVAEAAATYQLSNGQTLAEASAERPLVLVFLRHFGCTFTRQILRGLQDLEHQAKRNNATLVLVHMLQSGQETSYLGENSDIPRIADPRCELYRAFGLGKGGFLELFGPHVWWRGMIAVFKGCGIGHLAGDGLQMPGAFVFHDGKIVSSQPARTAADLPDLESLFSRDH
ncbi:redoxin domain-containing protein [Akkermansiaceae bacterium]|nr:redoxin domain-containing protein [Akkermansiaceae bacterium]